MRFSQPRGFCACAVPVEGNVGPVAMGWAPCFLNGDIVRVQGSAWTRTRFSAASKRCKTRSNEGSFAWVMTAGSFDDTNLHRSSSSRVVRFRPCIDLHGGRVKQIVGSSLSDDGKNLQTNFETELSPGHFAKMYARDNLPGGHVIMLGAGNKDAAFDALSGFPGGLHVGGGINPENALGFLEAGASHVIVTSYVFRDGVVDWGRIDEMVRAVGQARLVLDVSCRFRAGQYVVCTDRWQKWTDVVLSADTVGRLCSRCDELLVHAVDVEGKRSGMDEELIARLADWAVVPVTYAGGVRSLDDLDRAKAVGQNRVDVTIGSALDIFGGSLRYRDAVQWQRQQERNVQVESIS